MKKPEPPLTEAQKEERRITPYVMDFLKFSGTFVIFIAVALAILHWSSSTMNVH